MRLTTLSIFLFIMQMAFAQEGNITVIKDPKLDVLVKKQGTPILPATTPQIDGFRLQLFFDSDRKAVDKARSKFVAEHPLIDTYIIYSAPNYVLKVGDFRNSYEAEKLKDELAADFPTSFVIKERINLPRIENQ